MPWRIELTATAEKQLGRLGAEPKRRILRVLVVRIAHRREVYRD